MRDCAVKGTKVADRLPMSRARLPYAAVAVTHALMLAAAVTELALGIDAQGQSLENVAEPLSS